MIYINYDFFKKKAYKMCNTRAILKNLVLFCKVFNKVSKKYIFFRFVLKLGHTICIEKLDFKIFKKYLFKFVNFPLMFSQYLNICRHSTFVFRYTRNTKFSFCILKYKMKIY